MPIKRPGLALVLVSAMVVVVAPSALAAPTIESEAGSNNATLMGEQAPGTNDVLTVDGSNVECSNITYNANGETANGATNFSLHPEFSSCTAFGFIGATVATANCNYRGMAGGTYSEVNKTWNSGELELSCGANPIKINAGSGTCVATIGSQVINSGIKFSNMAPANNTNEKMTFTIHAENAVTAVVRNVDGFGCPFTGTGVLNGTYNGLTALACTRPSEVSLGCTASSVAGTPTIEIEATNSVTLMGEQAPGTNDVLTVDGSNVECSTITYNANGETANGATNVDLHPEFSSCTAFGFIGANINTTNCNYRAMASGTEDANMYFNAGELQLTCNVSALTINAGSGTCIVTIGTQAISSGIRFSNMTPTNNTNEKKNFTIHMVSAPVALAKNQDGFGCPLNGTGITTGTYSGTITVRCTQPTTTYANCTVKP